MGSGKTRLLWQRPRERIGSAAALLEWAPSLGLSYAKNVRDLRTMACRLTCGVRHFTESLMLKLAEAEA